MDPKNKPLRERKRYDAAFKRDCVALLEQSGKTLKEMAGELGIAVWSLRDWRQRARRANAPARVPQTLEEKDTELIRLRRENESLRTQRDILKKALGIVADEPGSATRR
jgi:transposase